MHLRTPLSARSPRSRRARFILPAAFLLLLIAAQGCQKQETPAPVPAPSAERGKYLVTIMGCHDCHSPKVMTPEGVPAIDTTRILSGHPAGEPHPAWTMDDLVKRNMLTGTNPHLTAWAGPWGVSYTANLTPDVETGLGEWTEEAFMTAIRTGKHQGQPNGRPILPPMPWEMIRHATDSDLKDIWAFLRSVPPVKNQVPTPVPPPGAPQH